ncbi:MAG: phosphotransferase family protein [Hyphomonadaceae bacterium]|nr:phosphotransferase family protein [Hyphomonadaceae bacterium]
MLTQSEIETLRAYLARALGHEDVAIDNVARIYGGASRETYSFDAMRGDARGGFILRRDPDDSLIESERALEFAAYQSFYGRNVPVPEAIALETDPSVLGKPFFIMRRIDGASAGSPFQLNAYGAQKDHVGRQFFTILGNIASVDPYDTQLPGVVETPAPEECWRRELDHWEGVIEADSLEPQPIARAALRRLRRNPPKSPPRLSIVHGDYRNGNFMRDGKGDIVAVLDWEMAHIGDALEDLAWALDPLWALGREDLAAGLIPLHDAVQIWEAGAQQKFDPERFQWWSLFASLKGLAIWISAAKAFHDGKNQDPVLGFTGWYCTARHNKILADRLAAKLEGV